MVVSVQDDGFKGQTILEVLANASSVGLEYLCPERNNKRHPKLTLLCSNNESSSLTTIALLPRPHSHHLPKSLNESSPPAMKSLPCTLSLSGCHKRTRLAYISATDLAALSGPRPSALCEVAMYKNGRP